MQEVDKYMYLMTDIILAIEKMDEPQPTRDSTPVLDSGNIISQPIVKIPFNIIDTLSEPSPSATLACNRCPPEKPKRNIIPKEEQLLIEFSSSSCSQESVIIENKEVLNPPKNAMVAKEVQCDIANDIMSLNIEDTVAPISFCKLPAQKLLETDHSYQATITHIDGSFFWVIVENFDEVHQLIADMTKHYKANYKNLKVDEIKSLSYCAFYEDDCYYRGLFLSLNEDETEAEVFLVDIGEICHGSPESIQRLLPQFASAPPYARCCHLAGIDLTHYHNNKDIMHKQEEFIRNYLYRNMCTIQVDDNTSESLGVYVKLSNNETLNEIIVRENLALPIDKSVLGTCQGPPEEYAVDDDLDIASCPEYEDPVEAVTGYHNRDEADICKNYKGGPEKTCFKGIRCTKKHIVKHPDGWTLDRVPVAGKCKLVSLPAADSWLKVLVTSVPHFNRVFVQFVDEHQQTEELPSFGVVLPARTLAGLVRDMNSLASRAAYKPLTVAPALGELVAALYPLDNNYYRARVRSLSRSDQTIELIYVDYGTVMWVKENEVKVLEPRWTSLPMQAVSCVLGGVSARTHLSHEWAMAKKQLEDLVLDKIFNAHVLSCDYDELTVELFDLDGYNIGKKFSALKLVNYEECDVVEEVYGQKKIVVP